MHRPLDLLHYHNNFRFKTIDNIKLFVLINSKQTPNCAIIEIHILKYIYGIDFHQIAFSANCFCSLKFEYTTEYFYHEPLSNNLVFKSFYHLSYRDVLLQGWRSVKICKVWLLIYKIRYYNL